MNSNSTTSESDKPPRRWNKLLIILAVLAFGLVVTDRVMEAFQADDEPVDVAASGSLPDASSAVSVVSQAADDASDAAANAVQDSVLDQLAMPTAESLVKLESLFGSPVVLVSSSEPSYVITEDERRFDVGGVVDDTTTLAGVTSHQLIFEQSGDLLVISLPEPVTQ